MERDLKEMFREHRELSSHKLDEGHEARFLEKLDKELPMVKHQNSFFFLKIAAAIAILAALGYGLFYMKDMNNLPNAGNGIVDTQPVKNEKTPSITLGDISPDLKKVEDYYLANINLELANIEVTEENKKLFDGYIQRLSELNDEYVNLNKELNTVGPNEKTVSAIITNLQLKLQLLYRLKEKLEELKENKNEKFSDQQI